MHAPSAPHEHDHPHHGGPHSHGDDHGDGGHENELFPRVLTTQLVGEREAQRLARERRQTWLLGAGLAILALGLPTARSLGQLPLAAPLVERARTALATALDMPRERTGFALAALSLGLAVPLIAATLRRVGFLHQALLPATLIAVLSPLAWVGSTGAAPFGLGVLASAWLLGELFAGRGPLRLLAGFACALVLHPVAALLLPALVLGAAFPPVDPGTAPEEASDGPSPSRRALTVALGGVALALAAHFAGLLPLPQTWTPAPFGRALLPLAGLGIALAGLIAPWVRSAEEVSRPPAWVAVFLLVPLPLLAFEGLALGSWMVPVAALGLADLVQRGGSDQATLVRGLGLLAAQALLTLGLVWTWEARDPDRSWRAAARRELEPTDLVITDVPLHGHLLRERWRVESTSTGAPSFPQRVRAAQQAGSRIVFDGELPTVLPPALEGVALVSLKAPEHGD